MVAFFVNLRGRIGNQRGCFIEVRFGGEGCYIMIDRYRVAVFIQNRFICFIQFIFAVKALELDGQITVVAGHRTSYNILGILPGDDRCQGYLKRCAIGIRETVLIIDTVLIGDR